MKKLYAGIFYAALALGCAKRQRVEGLDPSSLVENYISNINVLEENKFTVNIHPKRYCYYTDRLYNGEILVVEDSGCNSDHKRLLILRDETVVISIEFKSLNKKTRSHLDHLIRSAAWDWDK